MITCLFAIFYSCQDKSKETQIKEVESLIKTNDSIRAVFIETRVDTLMKYITKIMDVEFRIRRSYVPDTIDVTFAKKLDDYKMVRKKLKPMLKYYSKMDLGTKEEYNALKKLKKDIENGSGDRSKYAEYVIFEQKKVEQLNEVLKDIIKTQKEQFDIFNRYHKELYDFSMSLEHVIK